MRFESRTFWLPKDADYPQEYMDAFALAPERGLAAIADGVSSAVFSRAWARLVAESVISQPPNLEDGEQFVRWLSGLRAAWRGEIEPLVAAMPPTERWRIKPKLVDGAMTTLLWLELEPPAELPADDPLAYRLRGYSIGDCALFHLRGDELLYSFPMQDSAAFAQNPLALGSVDRKLDHLLEFVPLEVTCLPGDVLVLATDAVGLWAMRRWEAGQPVAWEDYWQLPEEAWREEVMSLRQADTHQGMRVDDTTLVLMRVVDERVARTAEELRPAAPELAERGAVAGELDSTTPQARTTDIDHAAVGVEAAVLPPLAEVASGGESPEPEAATVDALPAGAENGQPATQPHGEAMNPLASDANGPPETQDEPRV